ncbi:hypothetical protein Zmor_013075 [Zophobas morio]|uniref:FAD-dependent oxidoreductase domain-containing protein 1 n=1 Tax=Zophobas morio TaxID=2755281 RepID=A0AA38MEY7_9CUCU|nr:hypothetical protein Zmor_013075 [Zophobas morio]
MFSKLPSKLLRTSNSFNKTSDNQIVTTVLQRLYSNNVVVIGGGAMGSSVAYWLKEKSSKSSQNVNVTVIEKDPTYSKCSTALSVGGIRQQFSVPENIQMSLFGARFIQNLKERFGPEADISYMPYGYLILASEKGAPQLDQNFQLQTKLGATNTLLSKRQLQERFPWLNVDDVELGCLGCDKEGWFDPWGLLSLLKRGAAGKGATFVQGEIVDFVFGVSGEPQGVKVRLPSKEEQTLQFDSCVLAAGAESGKIAKLARIGLGSGGLAVPLPVEKRKRFVYRFDSQGTKAPPLRSPLTIDFTGAYFRNDGVSYIGGASPKPEDEPTTENLDVDFDFFDRYLWTLLANRIPAFESLKVKGAWGGYYEYNTFDENGIIGGHNVYKNLYFATGFSGHGIQQSPAVGLAIAELLLHGKFQTIDLSRLGFDRLITHKPLYETEIY